MSQSTEHDAPSERGSVRSAVADAIVRLHAEHYGRGPRVGVFLPEPIAGA